MNKHNRGEPGDVLKKNGTVNEGFAFASHTLARTESSLTEMTDIPAPE